MRQAVVALDECDPATYVQGFPSWPSGHGGARRGTVGQRESATELHILLHHPWEFITVPRRL
jgi:hypothetical protein